MPITFICPFCANRLAGNPVNRCSRGFCGGLCAEATAVAPEPAPRRPFDACPIIFKWA
jgi:hypothetical protein